MATMDARQDRNRFPTLIGVGGTAGTADSSGTAGIVQVGVNPTTGALYVQDLGASSSGTNVNIVTGTITQSNVATGTQQTLGTVGVVNNIVGGTITRLLGGTVDVGIVGTSTSFTGVGTLNLNLSGQNSLAIQASNTWTASFTVDASVNGTNWEQLYFNIGGVASLSSAFASNGIMYVNTAGLSKVRVKTTSFSLGTADINMQANISNNPIFLNGFTRVTSGTITSITNLAGGTIQQNKIPVQVGTSFVAVGTTGVAVWGTLVAASGAGTKQYVSGVDIVVTSGTVDVAVTNIGVGGSTGAGILARGQFVPSGGISKNFDPVIASGTNGTLSYWLGGAGTVAVTVQYWQGV